MTLEQLGYKLVAKDVHGKWTSETWEKVSEHGWCVQHLLFDTIHGGSWTFESYIHVFCLNQQLDWTTQERIAFNPASRDFIGSNIGHWCKEPSVLDVDECCAIAEHISKLEHMRLAQRNVVDA